MDGLRLGRKARHQWYGDHHGLGSSDAGLGLLAWREEGGREGSNVSVMRAVGEAVVAGRLPT